MGRTGEAAATRRRLGPSTWLVLAMIVVATGGWYVQRGRDFDRETSRIAEALALRAGMTVADVGAGDGSYTVFLAERVGEAGHVFSTEVEQDKVDDIREAVGGRSNVTVILGGVDDTRLPEACCERILLRRVYHHFLDPDVMAQSLFRSLEPGGVIAVVDFLPRNDLAASAGTPDRGGHGTPIEALTEEMTRNGFELVGRVENWPGSGQDYCVLFRRPSP